MTTDPFEADASDRAGFPVSAGSGLMNLEVPVLSTRQHLDLLVGLITNEWRKTMTMWKSTSTDMGIAPCIDELVVYNPDEDSVIKFRVDQVPEAVRKKVDCLEHMKRIGLGHLDALEEMLKEELDKVSFDDISDESSGSNGTETSIIEMLAELARHRMQIEYAEKKELGLNLTVVFVNASGRVEKVFHTLQPDTDFASFLVLMDDYPTSFDDNVVGVESIWDEKIQNLKSMGYDGHPSLVKIEQLITAHKTTNYDDGPKWMYYKTNGRIYNTKKIEDERVFKKILEILTNPAKKDQRAVMVRVVDQKLMQILGELRCLEIQQEESIHPSNQVTLQRTQDEWSDLQTGGMLASCNDSPYTWDMWFNSISKDLGNGVFWPDTSDGDHEDEEGDPMEL
ncbi:hypothetical protein diail_3251 [Diaporthe ilicicola]|nr:hypothetical protein diail_3251 [Diaporthe ilicicola]